MSRVGPFLISSDDASAPAVATSTEVLSTAQGGTGQDTSDDSGVPRIDSGTWSVAETLTLKGATAAGAKLEMKPTHADGYCQMYFYPEQGANQDVGIVAHKILSGTETVHRHLTIYTSESVGAAPQAKVVLEYGTADAELLLSRCHLNFDTTAAPNANGGYAEQIVLKNLGYVTSWNAANGNILNLIGLNGTNEVEVGNTTASSVIVLLNDASMETGKYFRFPVVATASLPAAGAANDGIVLIEETGGATCNLVFYKNGRRFKAAGTEA